ncbi:metallo-beta-lactamase domain-containing protein 1 [Condylostylus longicornis]|uniref:metallo-beta-lactamase domain-containing protein 1 n=1 Tax=Condylostylus longicornis TaxID=2530218 RepID=UPI00244E48C2|nr:metallo-beta-lactamase domain-containing protein 1 [Condylostylus longicornis]
MDDEAAALDVNEIYVLYEGYSYIDPQDSVNSVRANCTCTLIKGRNNYNIIVDTMTPWDKDKILQALSEHNIKPEDIKIVVSTHGHSDHCGNNNLFTNAEYHIVGECISCKDKYLKHDFRIGNFHLTDDISIMPTPGHTLTCVTVLVENTNLAPLVAVCGDLFEKEEDIIDQKIWLDDGGSESPDMQRENRAKIAEMVDYIIPGHGKGFEVSNKYRDLLRVNAGLSEKDIERFLRDSS